MKCYYHHEADAVAICKSCGRALCPGCAADVGPGTACKQRCEENVAALNVIVERSKSAYAKAGRVHKRHAIWLLILGLVFIGFGGLPILLSRNYGASFMVVFGIVFLLGALFSFTSGRQIASVK